MWKVLWSLAFIALVAGENITANAENKTISGLVPSKNASSTNLSTTTTDKKSELRHDMVVKSEVGVDKTGDAGSVENPFEPSKLAELPGEEASLGNFKYYFILMVVSSLSVISIIIFKALRLAFTINHFYFAGKQNNKFITFSRLRKSRAEIKYGKASLSDRSEVEPLGRTKWLEESSDENEDEIFDINFLKNSRTQSKI